MSSLDPTLVPSRDVASRWYASTSRASHCGGRLLSGRAAATPAAPRDASASASVDGVRNVDVVRKYSSLACASRAFLLSGAEIREDPYATRAILTNLASESTARSDAPRIEPAGSAPASSHALTAGTPVSPPPSPSTKRQNLRRDLTF